MLKKIEIVLTVVSILLGVYEVLGRTDVVKGPTPIEAVRDALAGDPVPEPGRGTRPQPPEDLEDLTISVQDCRVHGDTVAVDVIAVSTQPITTIEGVGTSATSGAVVDSGSVIFDNSTTSTGRTFSLGLGPGSHTITLVVDPDDRYEETDESNNVAEVIAEVPSDTFTMGYCPVG
jgi:hypothetical protein